MPRKYSMVRRAQMVQETRARIVAALRRLLEHEHYGAISLQQIAREANVSLRTVQRHFPSRHMMLETAGETCLSELGRAVNIDPATDDLNEAVRAFITTMFHHFAASSALILALFDTAREDAGGSRP